jgi:hypothetical protein
MEEELEDSGRALTFASVSPIFSKPNQIELLSNSVDLHYSILFVAMHPKARTVGILLLFWPIPNFGTPTFYFLLGLSTLELE